MSLLFWSAQKIKSLKCPENKFSYRFYCLSKELYFHNSLHLFFKFIYLQNKNGLHMLCYRLPWDYESECKVIMFRWTHKKYSEDGSRQFFKIIFQIHLLNSFAKVIGWKVTKLKVFMESYDPCIPLKCLPAVSNQV